MKNIENLRKTYKIINNINLSKSLKIVKVSLKYLSNISEKFEKDRNIFF